MSIYFFTESQYKKIEKTHIGYMKEKRWIKFDMGMNNLSWYLSQNLIVELVNICNNVLRSSGFNESFFSSNVFGDWP